MSYALLTPSGHGTLCSVYGPFVSEQDAEQYAKEMFYCDPRWGRSYNVVPLQIPIKPPEANA